MTYFHEQPLIDQKLIFDNTVMLDASQGGGGWIQPTLRYQPGERWRYEAYYNFVWRGIIVPDRAEPAHALMASARNA